MANFVRIGTRDSELALWQANTVKSQLESKGQTCELVFIKSGGDMDQQSTFQNMGSVGIFTKALDQALLRNEIDIAVHSLKDAPTVPENGLCLAAVLKRENPYDLLIRNGDKSLEQNDFLLGTGSIRRQAQWRNRFPNHEIKGIRGNVGTRLRKLEEENFDGIILANAGLIRLGSVPDNSEVLDWMIPAPAQGIIGIYCRSEDALLRKSLDLINHEESMLSAIAERSLLNELEGGCSAPIGALAIVNDQKLALKACLLSEDGKYRIDAVKKGDKENAENIGRELAREMLAGGGNEIIMELRHAQ